MLPVKEKERFIYFRIRTFRYFRSIRIGKILVNEGHVIYAKLPADVHQRRVLVTYPVITTGSTVLIGLEVLLKEYQCMQSNIILTTLFSTPEGIKHICESYPDIKIVVSEINKVAPNHFAQKYFGKSHRSLPIFLIFTFQVLINNKSRFFFSFQQLINNKHSIICICFFFFSLNKFINIFLNVISPSLSKNNFIYNRVSHS